MGASFEEKLISSNTFEGREDFVDLNERDFLPVRCSRYHKHGASER